MKVMGILNVTPDSFSDGGRWFSHDDAVAHGLALVAQGADIVDIGGESTRPGAQRIPIVEEQRRILPIIRALSQEGVTISVDTLHAETARAAIEAGAAIINDVSGGLADAAMLPLAGDLDVPYLAMHWRGYLDMDPAENAARAQYADVVEDVRTELEARVGAMLAAGITEDHIVLDPGLGFHKGPADNWTLLRHLESLRELGYPILVGASRKRFLQATLPVSTPDEATRMHLLDTMTSTISVECAVQDIWGVRVHDVAGTVSALATHRAWTHSDALHLDEVKLNV